MSMQDSIIIDEWNPVLGEELPARWHPSLKTAGKETQNIQIWMKLETANALV